MPPTPKQGECQLLLEPSQQMGRFQGNAGETGEVFYTPEGCRMGGHGGPEASPGRVLMGIAFLRSPTVFIPDSGSWVAQRKEGKY